MRFFGLTIKVKKEPRYVSREELAQIYNDLRTLDEGMQKLSKAIEATRVRVYQKGKANGDELPPETTAEERGAAAREEVPGADPSIYFGGI